MHGLGFVQKFGAGLAIARKASGSRLRFQVQPTMITAIIDGEP
jgi:ATP-dependent DNA helicase RecG